MSGKQVILIMFVDKYLCDGVLVLPSMPGFLSMVRYPVTALAAIVYGFQRANTKGIILFY